MSPEPERRPPAPDSADGRPVNPVRVSYTQTWLYFLFVVCFLVAWWFPIKLFLQHSAFMKGRAEGPRDAESFVALAYAGVSALTNEVSPAQFKAHLKALREAGYHSITAEDVKGLLREGKPVPRKAVLLTFDHGRKTSYFDTRAALRRGGWHAVMFLWTGPIESQDPANLRWPYINEMVRSRTWQIGAQSDSGFAQVTADSAGRRANFMTSPRWLEREKRYETLEEFKNRLNEDHLRCRAIIEKNTGRNPSLYAFPYGDFGQYDSRAVLTRRVNLDLVGRYYDLGFVVGNKALNTRYSDPRRLNRLLVDPRLSPQALIARLEQAWPMENAVRTWKELGDESAWIVDWGSMTAASNRLLLAATPDVTGAKMWLSGSDLCKDSSVRLQGRLLGGQLNVYLRASADEESYVGFGMDRAGNAWVRQKFTGLEPYTLAVAQSPDGGDGVQDLDLYVRDKIFFATRNGKPLFAKQVVLRGATAPGLLGLSVWDALPGVASAEIRNFSMRPQSLAMAEWSPRVNRGPYVADWVGRNAYRLTHLSPPWLRVTQQGVIQSGLWDPLLNRMLARAYHLELAPNVWIEREQWLETFTADHLAQRLDEEPPEAVYVNLGDVENPSIAKLARWLQQAGERLKARGVRLVVRLPRLLEQASTLPAMLAVIPNVQVAAMEDSPLLESLADETNQPVRVESLPMPPADLDLALYYEITGLAGEEARLNKETRAELLRQEGHLAFRNGEFSRAIALWSQWHELEPGSEESLMLIGDAYLRLFETEKALDYYARSLAINPGQIELAMRRIRLIDEAGKADEALKMLNLYARVFPNHADVTLAQAEWLIRHERRREAVGLVRRVLDVHPGHTKALTLMQGMLEAPAERYANMRQLRDLAKSEILQIQLGEVLWYNELLGLPEFCVMADLVERLAADPDRPEVAALYRRFMPRAEPAVEDFTLGKLSENWLTSSDYPGEEGRIHLRASRAQAEVYLRLVGSDTMRNGFIEAELDDVRGFFWLYARRRSQNMIRFGFDQAGNIYLQAWRQGAQLINESRPWFKPRGRIKLRLDVQGDGARGYVDGRAIFASAIAVPADMGLGWWGMAPYAVKLGTANATLHNLSAGPLPVQLAVLPPGLREDRLLEQLKPMADALSAVAPSWFQQLPDGQLQGDVVNEDIVVRMFARYHRIRLLPVIQMVDYDMMTGAMLSEAARRHHTAGFVLMFDETPPDAWMRKLTRELEADPVDVLVMAIDDRKGLARLREMNLGIGLFPASEKTRVLPVVSQALLDEHRANEEVLDVVSDAVFLLEIPEPAAP